MKTQLRNAKIILQLLHQQRKGILLLGLGSSAMKTITAFLPLWFTTIFINSFQRHGFFDGLWWLILLLGVFLLGVEGLQYLLEYHLHIAIKELELELEKNISGHAMLLSYELLEDKASLDLIQKAKAGIEQNGGIQQMMIQLSTLLECLFTMALSMGLVVFLITCHGEYTSGILALLDSSWIALLLIILLLCYAMFGRYLSKAFEKAGMIFFEQNASLSRESTYYSDEVALNQAMAKDVRLFQMQDTMLEEMDHRMKKSLHCFSIFNHRIAMLFSESVFLGNLMNGMFYMFIIIKVYVKAIPIGDFVTYAGTIAKLNDAISQFPIVYTDLSMLFSYMMFYHEFLSIPIPNEHKSQKGIVKEDSMITFDDVSYRYPGSNQMALQHVSLTFNPHQKTAVVGLNGAGKTTLIKLLCGLYAPSNGEIKIDDVAITTDQNEDLQKGFGVVFQDFSLFEGTMKENITGGRAGDDREIETVLQRSGFGNRLHTLEKGIDTKITLQSGGIQLSGGEAQKVAIARALYANRPWIILDEPTAALDPLAEIEIYTHLNDLIKEKSAIYISHRMSSCQFCDDIIVFENGSVVQRGTHAQLVKQKGLYQQLWNAQAEYFQMNTNTKEIMVR